MKMQYNILIVEDESDINELLVKILEEAQYKTVQAFSGTEAKLLLEKKIPDLILLDLMLPGISGEELLYDIRENKHSNVPVLVLSAKNSLGDKVSLLKDGADDYITKPFELEEVIARVQSALRRLGKEDNCKKILTYKDLQLNPQGRIVKFDGTEIELTAHEYDILYLLIKNPEKVYSRESLYELVWHGGYYGENNTVNVHVSNLRKKLKEAGSKEDYIQTVYGIGFKLQ
jgi:DNA-binding response OmpR family regulator